MLKNNFLIVCILLTLVTLSCARRGALSGGDKDTIAPVLKASFPKNFSTNFKGKEIELVFDEYIKLKNLDKQLIISPILKNKPEISPQLATKKLKIKLNDTLLPNTTYSFNFGQSIEDNNEGNPLSQFKFVFSTGTFIDSLALNVRVKDALEKNPEPFISVMLYEINDTYNDSTVYKETPKYISNTLDKSNEVRLENLKQGKYLLIALKDNGNDKYNPSTDKVAFHKQYITVPNDSVFELKLFKEKNSFNTKKPIQTSKNRLLLGYEGDPKNTSIKVKNGAQTVPVIVTKFPNKDSLQIWYKPVKADSLEIEVANNSYRKNYYTKISDSENIKQDTLSFSPEFKGTLPLRERFSITSNTPLLKFDKSKISIFNKDSMAVAFDTEYVEREQKLYVNFNKEPQEKYKITMLPGAFTDFYESQNDTLKYKVITKNYNDYGNLKVTLENVKKYPLLLQLTDKDGKVKASQYSEKNSILEFLLLEPNTYSLRVIYDDNLNQEWDTGSYPEKKQPEEVIYFPKDIDIRANWDIEQPFDLGIMN